MAYLECSGIRRSFGHLHAVDGASLAVERGEFIGLLGPSGSGKTTLLRIVAGFEHPDSGTLRLDGRDITRLPPQRRDMGMVFQSYALFPNMTAYQNVAFGLNVRRQPRALVRDRVLELLALVGLADKARHLPHQLSGGEQQRIALARALAPSPRVLLLDEPLSALDARIRLSLRHEIRRIQRSLQITTLYVTHDQEEALAMSDRVVVFHAGRIEQFGRPEEIYDRPASPFVAGFVGTTNLLQAEVLSLGGTCSLDGQSLDLGGVPPGVREGDRLEIRVRPEHIHLSPLPGGSRLHAKVEDVMFLGDRLSLRVSLGRQAVWVDMPREPGGSGPCAGEEVDLYLPRQALAPGAPRGSILSAVAKEGGERGEQG